MAMIEAASARGYTDASIRELSSLAGVSGQTIYDEFGNKEAYFLATYDLIVRRAILRVNTAYRSETNWAQQLVAAFNAYAQEVVEQPKAARIALIEALGAGPRAIDHMEQTSHAFEKMIDTSFARAPDHVTLPPLLIKGIVGGISRVTRQALIDGSQHSLPSHATTLLRWAFAYRTPTAQQLPTIATLKRSPSEPALLHQTPAPSDQDKRTRILHSAARIAATRTYNNLTVAQIIQDAQVSDEDFFALYNDREQCFLAAYDQLGADIVKHAAQAALDNTDWCDSIVQGISALMHRVARDPVFARCAFLEVFAVGNPGLACRSRLMDNFTTLLTNTISAPARPPRSSQKRSSAPSGKSHTTTSRTA